MVVYYYWEEGTESTSKVVEVSYSNLRNTAQNFCERKILSTPLSFPELAKGSSEIAILVEYCYTTVCETGTSQDNNSNFFSCRQICGPSSQKVPWITRGKEEKNPTPPSFPQKRHCVVLKIPLRFSSTWNSTELCSSTISTQRTVSFWKNRKCQKGLQAVIKNSPISLIAQT